MTSHLIDFDVLRGMRKQAESMIAYYGRGDEKIAQNAAMAAAGLKPLHDERQIQWDRDHLARTERELEVLDAVLAHFGEVSQAEAA